MKNIENAAELKDLEINKVAGGLIPLINLGPDQPIITDDHNRPSEPKDGGATGDW
jgi:hypothetical protein